MQINDKSDDYKLDDLEIGDSLDSSEDGVNRKVSYEKFTPEIDLENPKTKLVMIFKSKEEINEAIMHHRVRWEGLSKF